MKKVMVGLLFMSLFFVSSVFGAVILCDPEDATVDNVYANYCYSTGALLGNPTAEALFINTAIEADTSNPMDTIADPFIFVDKFPADVPDDDGMAGWLLTVIDLDDGFAYTLEAPEPYSGAVVDFALGVKQATYYIAYIFESVTLDINGVFSSTVTGEEDYSHVSAFIVGAAPVPEPSTLLLLGAGIAGFAVYRRKKH